MLYTHAAAALIALAVGFGGGWKVQAWRWGAADAERLALEAKGAEQARAAERRQHVDVLEAVNASKRREQTARAAADGARTELDGLRVDLATAQQHMPSAAPAACLERVATLSAVFESCAATLEGLAGKADRINSDRLMLREAWPKLYGP